FGRSMGVVVWPEKENEIAAIPELLRLGDIEGAIITIDALGAQKAIAEQIVDSGADYVLALKANQETLHRAVIDHIDRHLDTDFADVPARRHQEADAGHGREEYRGYIQMPVPEALRGAGAGKGGGRGCGRSGWRRWSAGATATRRARRGITSAACRSA